MNSTYEFGIYLTHFCNVDLFRQGLYFFRIALYNKTLNISEESSDGETKHFALPYRTMIGKQHERDFLVRSKDRPSSMGHIDDVTSSFCSSVFRVQYQEQKVRLNEGCLFRLDLPYEPKQRVYIDIELVFCELHASDYKTKGFPTFSEFTIVDKTSLCMEDCYSGIHSIYPVSFSTSHFCLANIMVHGELINFKFIPSPPQYKLIAKYAKLKQLNGKNISDMNHHYTTQHILNSNHNANNSHNLNKANKSASSDQKQSSADDKYASIIAGTSSFAEVLFYDKVDDILRENDWQTVSEHHLFYVHCLLCTYEKLQKLVDEYVDKYLDDANIPNLQNEFDALYPVPNIQLDAIFSTPVPQKNIKTQTNTKTHTQTQPPPQSQSQSPPATLTSTSLELFESNGYRAPSMPSLINSSSFIAENTENFAKKYGIIAMSDRFSAAEKAEMTGRKMCHIIGEDVHKIAGQVFRIWHFFLSIIPYCKRLVTRQLLYEWEKTFVERWGACIFRETLTVRARLRVVSTSLSEHEMISRKVRNQSTLNQLEAPPLQDIIYMIDPKKQAVIFEQTYNLPDNRHNRLLAHIPHIPVTPNKENKFRNKFKKNKKGFIVVHRKKKHKKEENENVGAVRKRSLDDNDVGLPSMTMNDSLHINLGNKSNINEHLQSDDISSVSSTDNNRKPPVIIREHKEEKKNCKKKKKRDVDVERDRDTDHECCGKHLFVLVHGYQGNSWDMRMFRNHLLVKCPNDLFLMSESNENDGNTEGDIHGMGRRLAAEIIEFIQLNIISQRHKLCRLSFITHSLGGIIARDAITCDMFVKSGYLDKCYTFISLAVCHCGYLFGRSKALQAGFWVMRSWKKSLCLSQLSLADHENARKTYIYKLSKKESLKWFKNVLLVSSPEDRYTPYHSTRIEMHRKTVQDTKWGRVYNEMVRNLLRPLDHVSLTRFDVSFVNRKTNLDSIIGRSAHICFLEQPLYIDMLIHVYKKYFVST